MKTVVNRIFLMGKQNFISGKFHFWSYAGMDKLHTQRPSCSGAQNHWDAPDFSDLQILPCKKEEVIRPTNLQSNR